ncbi:hypothetical protein [Pseudomonas sp. GD03944]|uniref:hypothetical protein n=1 Tax=Pseudomonas sp. GD03944 TaxID=2975409 RepID=UPI00244B3856|nr:hypothetical protein [Pseudomonas sp. GD03944]MDH1264613.1 hypothetical protein [Pseudomonas sp. GD03944]
MADTLYLKLRSNCLHLSHLESGGSLELEASPAFSNPRLLVADFSAASALLKQAIAQLLPKRFMRLSMPPKLLIQPLDHLEGGLSPVEERILLELGHGCGARTVRLHVGTELDASSVHQKLA